MTDVPASRIRLRDFGTEILAGIAQRPGRSILTALGTVLGVGVLVSVLGLSASAGVQISRQFDLTVATTVTVTQVPDPVRARSLAFPVDAEARAEAIEGVTSASLVWQLPASTPVTAHTFASGSQQIPILAAGQGSEATSAATIREGRWFDGGHVARRDRVAVVGVGAARELGLGPLATQPTISIDGVPFVVIGVVSDVVRLPEVLSSVVIPFTTAQGLWGDPEPEAPARLVISVRQGAASVVGRQVAVAMRPDASEEFSVALPPDPQSLRENINHDLDGLFLLLAYVCLVVGMLGIANTTFVAVLERTGEIGLRRALGARPRHIAAHVLGEAALLGALGGLVGTSLGTLTILVACVALRWTAVVSVGAVVVGPLIGLFAGLIAGLQPAIRASRIEPIEALRS